MNVELLTLPRKKRNKVINILILIISLIFLISHCIELFVAINGKLETVILAILLVLITTVIFLLLLNIVMKRHLSINTDSYKVELNSLLDLKSISCKEDIELTFNFVNGIEVSRKSAFQFLTLENSIIEINYKEYSVLDLSPFGILSLFI